MRIRIRNTGLYFFYSVTQIIPRKVTEGGFVCVFDIGYISFAYAYFLVLQHTCIHQYSGGGRGIRLASSPVSLARSQISKLTVCVAGRGEGVIRGGEFVLSFSSF